MKRPKIVNGFRVGEEVELDDWMRTRAWIVGFSGDGKRAHIRYPVDSGLVVWVEVIELRKKSDIPRTGYQSRPTPS